MFTKEELQWFTKRYNRFVGWLILSLISWVPYVICFSEQGPSSNYSDLVVPLAFAAIHFFSSIVALFYMICIAVKFRSKACLVLTILLVLTNLGCFGMSFWNTPISSTVAGFFAFLGFLFFVALILTYNSVFRIHHVTPSLFIKQEQLDMATCSDSEPIVRINQGWLTKEELRRFAKRYNRLIGCILFFCALVPGLSLISLNMLPEIFHDTMVPIVAYNALLGLIALVIITDLICLAIKIKSTYCWILTLITFIPVVSIFSILALLSIYRRVFQRHNIKLSLFIKQTQLDMAICSDSVQELSDSKNDTLWVLK